MARFTNNYPGILVMPNGEEVIEGASVDIDDATAKNIAVAAWIADKVLTGSRGRPPGSVNEPEKASE